VERVLVSACLLGRPVRYDGRAKRSGDAVLARWQAEGRAVPFCPEVAAGLPTPRPPAEIEAGADGVAVLTGTARIVEQDGTDVTEAYRRGALLALEAAAAAGCRFAVLTDGSPSCGSSFIYDGSFAGRRHPGQGVAAALLAAQGIEVVSEAGIEALDARLRGL
jgi:uncharacterized protein YbbK (DUF523 family)